MSTVKTNNVQVGQSVTATNNFTLYQPATPDGTVRLGVGNTGATTADVASFTSAGLFSFNSGYGSAAVAYGCRAWVNFNGTGTVAIRASGNVSSITDNATGNYRVNFTVAMPDANYSVNVTIGSTSTDSQWTSIYIPNTANGGPPTTTSCGVNTGYVSGSTQGDLDPVRVNVAIFR